MRHLRYAAMAAALVTAAAAAPAAARGTLVANCDVDYVFSGGGIWNVTGWCVVTGEVDGHTVSGLTSFSALLSAPYGLCPPTGTMSGNFGGSTYFNLIRVGPAGVITTTGAIDGGGAAAFTSPCVPPPQGNESMMFTITGT